MPELKQIRAAHASANPKDDNPAWKFFHRDLGYVLSLYDAEVYETDRLKKRLVEAAKTEREWRDVERKRILAALVAFLEDGGGSFRGWLDHLGMDYCSAYDDGWMNFTNALSDHEDAISLRVRVAELEARVDLEYGLLQAAKVERDRYRVALEQFSAYDPDCTCGMCVPCISRKTLKHE